jgi:hypothetical protein
VPWKPDSRLRSDEIGERLEERWRAREAAAAGRGGLPPLTAREQELAVRVQQLEADK